MLSWVRTAISLITFGFGVQQFFRIGRTGVPESRGFIGPHEFGLMMIVIGLLALLLVTLEQRAAINMLRVQYPVSEGYLGIPRSRANLLAALIAVLGLLALSSMIF
jgi:putative membrane protein